VKIILGEKYMEQAQINISKSAYKKLYSLAIALGKKESEIVNLAILNYKPTKNINRNNLLRKAKGIWADRTDMDLSSELRNSWERNIDV
jgi:hypothetical protein